MTWKTILGSLMTVGVMVGVSSVSSVSTGCISECAALCVNDVTATGTVHATTTVLDGAAVSFCRNGKCQAGTVVAGGSNFVCDFAEAPLGMSCNITEQADGSFKAELHYAFEAGADPDPEDGDKYSVTITSGADSTQILALAEKEIEYEEYDYCGQDCYRATF